MNEQENELFIQMLKFSNSINNLLEKLSELEINNQKESNLYKKYINYLKIAVETENNFYQNLSLKEYNIEDILRYLNIKPLSITTNNKVLLSYKRIMVRLNNILVCKFSVFNKNYLLQKKSMKKPSKIPYGNGILNKYLSDYLEEIFYNLINDNTTKKDRSSLIKLKYYLCNNSSILEHNAIDNNFNKTIPTSPKWIISLTPLSVNQYTRFINLNLIDLIRDTIDILLLNNHGEFENYLYYLLLRSYFVPASDILIKTIDDEFSETTDCAEETKNINLIIKAFCKRKNDIMKYEGIKLSKEKVFKWEK